MKKTISIILGVTFLSMTLFASRSEADVEQRRLELFKILDEELKEVTRLNKQTEAKRPDLLLRMAQVLLEKGRLLKDQENQKYLDAPSAEREKINKDDLYKDSRRYFDQAQKTVNILLSKFPKFDERADAYYIMAYNAKELKQDEQSKQFFQKALEESKPDSIIADKARIALAEIYFNKGSFDKSMELYESALKNKRDKWWTKDAFNLAWCYFKLSKMDKAISYLLQSYELSKNSNYIDMSKSIERDLAFFYTEAGRGDEAITFYKKNGKSVSEVMLKVGRYLKTQGKFAAAEKTLSEGLEFKQNEKEEIEFTSELLGLYEKFGREQKHLEACRTLSSYFSKGSLNADQIEILKYNTQKMAAIIQQQMVNRTYDHHPDIKEKKAQAGLEYFMISATVVPAKAQDDYFHAGETFFAMGDFDKAIPLYSEAIIRAKKNGDKKIESMAGNSLMVSLGKEVKKSTLEKYLVPAYEYFLASNPRGEKSSLIYQRLFSAHFDKKNIDKAEKVLLDYKSNIPEDNETQEQMLARVMDYYKTNNNSPALANWIKKIESKEFKVSPGFAANVKNLGLAMQFQKVEELNDKGDKREALKGYYQIYKSPESISTAKANAAHNIALIFFEAGYFNQMRIWANKSVEVMQPSEVARLDGMLIGFSTDMFLRRKFSEAAELNEKYFDKICNEQSGNKRIFLKNANIAYITDGQFEKSRNLLAKASRCSISADVLQASYLDLLSGLGQAKKWGSYSEIIQLLEKTKSLWPKLIFPTSLLANELEKLGRIDDAKKLRTKMTNFYDNSRKLKQDIPVDGLDAIASLHYSKIEEEIAKNSAVKLTFPVNVYNKIIQDKFLRIDRINEEIHQVLDTGSSLGTIRAYRYVVSSHEQLRNEILSFVPAGKSAEFVSSFKKAMIKMTGQLKEQADESRKLALEKIAKEEILSDDSAWFLSKNTNFFIPKYVDESAGIVMDKAGVQ